MHSFTQQPSPTGALDRRRSYVDVNKVGDVSSFPAAGGKPGECLSSSVILVVSRGSQSWGKDSLDGKALSPGPVVSDVTELRGDWGQRRKKQDRYENRSGRELW